MKEITYVFMGFTGIDALWYTLPERWQARKVALALLRTAYKGLDLTTTQLVIRMPKGCWRVLDDQGRVEPTAHTLPTGL